MHAEPFAAKRPAPVSDRIRQFEALRKERDAEMAHSFRDRFNQMVSKYDTLCRTGMVYKKMSKVSFIEKTGGVGSILSTLNKLTPSNAVALSDKIVFKCNASNVIDMISQILSYGSNAEVNHDVLTSIVVSLSMRHADLKPRMQHVFDEYYDKFVQHFQSVVPVSSPAPRDQTDYEGFLDQNVLASRIKGSLRMMVAMGCNPKCAQFMKYTVDDVFRFLVERLDELFVTEYETPKCLLTDCLYIVVSTPNARSHIDLNKLRSVDFPSRYHLTTNRHRFRMYDIFDIVDARCARSA